MLILQVLTRVRGAVSIWQREPGAPRCVIGAPGEFSAAVISLKQPTRNSFGILAEVVHGLCFLGSSFSHSLSLLSVGQG